MQYTLQLVEEKVKQQQVTALHLISALAFLGAGAIIFKFNAQVTNVGLALLLVAITLMLLTISKNRWLTRPGNNRLFRVVELVISSALFTWSVTQQWKVPMGLFGVLSAALLFSMFWERKSNSVQYITINDNGMILPAGVRSKALEWTGIDTVLLRFGVLTVNTSDNFRYQWNVHKPDFNTTDFEQFCNAQIEAAIPRRAKDDW